MRFLHPEALRDLLSDIELEISRLERLSETIYAAEAEIERDPDHAQLFYESLALKLHNFYTGCERIFRLVATEMNGGLPSGADWHKRLLDRMSSERQGRPALVSASTAAELQEFLGFRHGVRSVYGYELDPERISQLLSRYPAVWRALEQDLLQFGAWLRELTEQMETSSDP
ncbi:MAG: hypothetical protein Q6M04_10775 [Thermostichus sp. BF3_bins_97]